MPEPTREAEGQPSQDQAAPATGDASALTNALRNLPNNLNIGNLSSVLSTSTPIASLSQVDTDGPNIAVAHVDGLTLTTRSGDNTIEVLSGTRGEVVRTIVDPALFAQFQAAVTDYTNGAATEARVTDVARSVFRR